MNERCESRRSTTRVRENPYYLLYQSSGIAVNWKIVILIRRCSRYSHSGRWTATATTHILYELYDTLQLRAAHTRFIHFICAKTSFENHSVRLFFCSSAGAAAAFSVDMKNEEWKNTSGQNTTMRSSTKEAHEERSINRKTKKTI